MTHGPQPPSWDQHSWAQRPDWPPADAPPPASRNRAMILALVGVVLLAAATVVVVIVKNKSDPAGTAAPSSTTATTSATPATGLGYFTEDRIGTVLSTVEDKTGDKAVYRVSLNTDGSAGYEVCKSSGDSVATYSISGDSVTVGAPRAQGCYDGFDTGELDPGKIASIVDKSTFTDSSGIELLIAAWDSTTPTILLTDQSSSSTEEYDFDGNLLGPVVNPLKAAERDEAIRLLVNESGITEAVQLCAYVGGNSVEVAGIDPDDDSRVIMWQYTNYAHPWDSWEAVTTNTFDPLTADLATPISRISAMEALFTDAVEGWNVCLSTEDVEGDVTVHYDLSDPGTATFDHNVVTSLDGTVLSQE